ncbi:MAG: hypothetical protein KC496_12290 [Anaerolineae bacterium]|nr:hypothetical protein [Anaerolineae bacterium]
MLLSFRLWTALKNPPRNHPLFHYALSQARKEQPRVTSGFFMWAFACSSITFFSTVILDWIPLLVLVIFLLGNTLYGVRWSLRISHMLMQEKEHRRYDLLAALPPGRLGTSWALSTGCLHQRTSFRWVPYLVGALTIILILTLLMTFGITLIVLQDDTMSEVLRLANSNILATSALALPVCALFYLDHQYATLTGILIAMLAPVDQNMIAEARTRVLLLFLSLQMLVYLVVFGVVLNLPEILRTAPEIEMLLQVIVGTCLFLGVREALVRGLWQTLTRTLHAEEAEIELVLQPAPARGALA